jgi:hypothetical protein
MPADSPNDEHWPRRGFDPDDVKLFTGPALARLHTAGEELQWLLDRGYAQKAALELIGRHHQLTVRQLMALQRSVAPAAACRQRLNRELDREAIRGQSLVIDGLNVIITLEVALSHSPLILGNDGVLRDLAGLRGTYHLIPQTDLAIDWIYQLLTAAGVPEILYFLDSPVANSGRLRARILEKAGSWPISVAAELVHPADALLAARPLVVSNDSVVLDRCANWYNLTRDLVRDRLPDAWIIDLSGS